MLHCLPVCLCVQSSLWSQGCGGVGCVILRIMLSHWHVTSVMVSIWHYQQAFCACHCVLYGSSLNIFYVYPRLIHLRFFFQQRLTFTSVCTVNLGTAHNWLSLSDACSAMHLLYTCIVFISMQNVHFTLSLIFSQVCRCQVISKMFLRSHQFCLNRFALSIDEFTWHNFGDPCVFGLCESRHSHAWCGIVCIVFLGRVRIVSLLIAQAWLFWTFLHLCFSSPYRYLYQGQKLFTSGRSVSSLSNWHCSNGQNFSGVDHLFVIQHSYWLRKYPNVDSE